MTKKLRSLTALLLVALLLGSLILPSSAAAGMLTGASSGATLVAGEKGSLPFTISYAPSSLSGYLGMLQPPFYTGSFGIISGITATLDTSSIAPLTVVGSSEIRFGQLTRGNGTGGAFSVAVPDDMNPTTLTARVNVSYNFYAYTVDANDPTQGTLSPTPETHSFVIDIPVTVTNPEYEAKTGRDIFAVTRRDIPAEVAAGERFTVSITVQNKIDYTLENVNVRLNAPGGCYFDDDTGVKIMSLLGGRSGRAEFDLRVSPDAASGSHQVTATVSYTNPAGETVSQDFYMTLDIKAAPTPIPADLQITAFTLPEEIKAGQTFTASVTVKNASADRTAENLTLALSQENGLQTLGATKQILPTLAPGESTTLTVEYMAPATAASAYCTFTANYSYSTAGITGTETRAQDGGTFLRERDRLNLTISEFLLPAELHAGQTFEATVTVTNPSTDQTAEHVSLALTQDGGLQPLGATKQILTALAPGASTTLTVKYAAPADLASVYCGFTATCSYNAEGDPNPQTVTRENGAFLREREKPALAITSLSIPETVEAGIDFTLAVTLTNRGGNAENLYFSIEPDAGFVYKSSTAKMIPALAKGQSTTLTFKLCGGENMTDGYKSIHLVCTSGGLTLLDDYTGITVEGAGKVNQSNDVPVIIISSYDYGKEVFGGQVFTLSLEFRNTSKTTSARDLKITVSSSGDDGVTAFTPANSSNTFFIEELAPGQIQTQTIDLLVKGDLAPKSYGINIRLEYKNGAGTASDSANETLAIPVKQEVRFNIGEISSLTDITTMEEAYLTATFGNLGKSTIYNVIVKVAGEGFSCYGPEYYAGNIEAGKHLTYDFYLAPNGPGFATGTLSYSYEDANGEQFTETQEFSFNINESSMNMGTGGGMMDPGFSEPIVDPETGYMFDEMTGQWIDPMTGEVVDDPTAGSEGFLGLPMTVWYIGGGAVVLIALIVVIVCVKRAKKRKQEAEDADF